MSLLPRQRPHTTPIYIPLPPNLKKIFGTLPPHADVSLELTVEENGVEVRKGFDDEVGGLVVEGGFEVQEASWEAREGESLGWGGGAGWAIMGEEGEGDEGERVEGEQG